MSPELLETLRHSPLTPWVGGVILLFLAVTLIRVVAQAVGKLIFATLLVLAGLWGYSWWQGAPPSSGSSATHDWFQAVPQNQDFSGRSLDALSRETDRLLSEAGRVSQERGADSAKEILGRMADTLKQKMHEASEQGETEARKHLERLHHAVRERLP